jgi:pentapeptide MXKDX repeat protein
MNSFKLTSFALMFASGIAGAAYAQDAMSTSKDSMAKPAMTDGMASKDSMGMKSHKKMAMKSGGMKHDAMKGDAMKSQSKSDSMKPDSMAH